MSMWSLDDPNPLTKDEPRGTPLARALADWLVLKPQREGDREAWTAMQLILPPQGDRKEATRRSAPRRFPRDAGWLARTKSVESNEGGVAGTFSVLDSVVLVDG
ncbi:hypothetical protein BKA82DRAFT_4209967 [Pisolithus tinctorius]|nr:hypothetical protein BKA82DRAFT_4209967 [Pisolithus tinctorius]